MKFASLLTAAAFFSTAAQASWVVPVKSLTCTANINPWGTSDSCACPEGLGYNEKIGKCLTGDPYPIMISGSIRSKDAVEKGAFIDTQVGKFQLIVKTSELERLQRVDGFYFEVEGEFLLLDKEPVIIVDRLSWLE